MDKAGPIRRWILAGFVVLNAVFGLTSASRLALAKQQGDPVQGALMSWPLLAIYMLSMVLFIVAAALLVPGKRSDVLAFWAAFAVDLGVFLAVQGPAYAAVFSDAQRAVSYVVFA